ncbi:MAG TPA: 6-phosphogluconolactonase, partial [Anaerolineaceae bacterium]|nr:6-phosphogluconolactonase [Anaerolineaceae bacterium]
SECQAYDQLARDMGGMDLQILGLGTTGHIAFNEPDSTFHPFTRLVNLDKSTMAANGHFFKTNEAVPHQAVTVGMRFILNSRLILLLVSSDKKAEALERTLNGPIDPMVPASILQLHPNVIIIADAEARSKL